MVTANQQIVYVVNKLKNVHKLSIADHGVAFRLPFFTVKKSLIVLCFLL